MLVHVEVELRLEAMSKPAQRRWVTDDKRNRQFGAIEWIKAEF
jgi:hypothetical protein